MPVAVLRPPVVSVVGAPPASVGHARSEWSFLLLQYTDCILISSLILDPIQAIVREVELQKMYLGFVAFSKLILTGFSISLIISS